MQPGRIGEIGCIAMREDQQRGPIEGVSKGSGSVADSGPDPGVATYRVSGLAACAEASPEAISSVASVAAQLASRLKASADFDPGSAV